ncbi:MAG: CinA family protein [Caulobacterales bacterium]|jgi:PncC family amidohydrolase
METLLPIAAQVAERLIARKHKLAVAESSAGGLISAALLAIPGASAYFVAGAVVYTPKSRVQLMGLSREDVTGLRSASEPYASLLASTALQRFSVDWALAETGAAGPTGNPYGDAAGHACLSVAGPTGIRAATLETGSPDRLANMIAFSEAGLTLLLTALDAPAQA